MIVPGDRRKTKKYVKQGKRQIKKEMIDLDESGPLEEPPSQQLFGRSFYSKIISNSAGCSSSSYSATGRATKSF